ncbi:MAG: M43 family zinc metalloprotease, partial [Saprospiraceae bacterium]|nr:M43 family zinc metalloprotease [Saprospiraceae bacterium]
SNIYSKDVYKKYGIKKDSIMNIFLMGFHVDSVASKTYKMSSNGVAFGKWTKIASWYYFMDATKWETAEEIPFLDHWNSQRLLNHELGHCLGLRHSWGRNDGCDDTPAHSNCWNYTQNGSDCDSLVSNNIMDYNAHAGAWTPCQIATVHYNLSNKKYRVRSLLKKTWCHYDTSKTIRIQKGEDINWNSAKDLEGDIIIEDGGSLTIRCRVSIPPNGRIIVKSQAKLILDGATLENDCGKSWKGIEVWKSKKMKGEVVMINDAKITEIENPIEVSAE